MRFIYALYAMWQQRKKLKQYMTDESLQLGNILELTAEKLHANAVHALALDYDGVLAAHGEAQPRPEVVEWLKQIILKFASHNVYILSNKPTLERKEFFLKHFPTIKFIIAKRKKPYPDGLQQILLDAAILPQQLLLVDDRLCTGILATSIVGTQGVWITNPYVNYKLHPLIESGIVILRWLEEKLLSLL